MDSRIHDRSPSADAIDFVRFCHRRRRVGWPELYDEMCAVAGRGLYRGWGTDELSAEGIGFSLFEMPALAVLVGRVVAEEQERRLVARTAAVERVEAGHVPAPEALARPAPDDRPAEPTSAEPVRLSLAAATV